MRGQSIFSFLENSARLFPDKTAVVFRKQRLTYRQMYEAAKKVAAFFAKRRKKGGVAAIFLENSADWLIAYFGILGSGMISLPLSLRSSDESLTFQMSLVKPRFIMTSPKFYQKCQSIAGRLRSRPTVIVLKNINAPAGFLKKFKPSSGKFSAVMFTSGTTSFQKAIKLTHRVVWSATRNIVDYLKPRYDDIYYAILPFYHSFGLGNVHTVFAVGGTVVISDAGTDLKKALREILKYRATFFAATPFTLEILVRHFLPDFIRAGEYLRVICTNTSPMPTETTKSILYNLPRTNFYTYYGLTEASRSSFMHYNLYPYKLTSVGRPSPNVEISIVNEKEKVLRNGATGEVRIRGEHVVRGYWKNPQFTKERFRNGWIYTGDMGYFDQEGFLYVVGRTDDMADIAGEKFSLEEVDRVLRSCPGVKDTASFLVNDPRMNFVAACVVREKGSEDNEVFSGRILGVCKKKLDRHQTPQKIIFIDSIPKTDNGKIKRNVLKKTYERNLS